jgi:molybdopterin-biosynthesis enzyme MoeA-like protein
MEGIARAFGTSVVRHPQLEALLRAFYGERLEERNLRMAEVPAGADLIAGDHPSWPVACMRNVYILPGVPIIFRRKFTAIRERFRARPFTLRRVYLMADEGHIARYLDETVAAYPAVSVGSYPRFDATDYRVVVTLEHKDPATVDAARDDLVRRVPAELVVRVD